MINEIRLVLILSCCSVERMNAQDYQGPDTVSVQSGKLTLKGLLWRPAGNGPFPTVIFCHGRYGGSDIIHNPEREASILGSVFACKSYIFFVLFRRGVAFQRGWGKQRSFDE